MYIGVVARLQKDIRDYYSINSEIVKVINDYSAKIIPIIFNFKNDLESEFNKNKELIDMCSGFILQGGSVYENIDLYLVKYLYDKDIPTLGICLGMQTMAMAFGGKIGNIYNHKDEGYVHCVEILKNTKLYEILNKNYILVNSRHKDYIISTDLKTSSRFNNIESIESSEKNFFMGLQWHPETLRDENSEKIFEYFFKKVKKYKKK